MFRHLFFSLLCNTWTNQCYRVIVGEIAPIPTANGSTVLPFLRLPPLVVPHRGRTFPEVTPRRCDLKSQASQVRPRPAAGLWAFPPPAGECSSLGAGPPQVKTSIACINYFVNILLDKSIKKCILCIRLRDKQQHVAKTQEVLSFFVQLHLRLVAGRY